VELGSTILNKCCEIEFEALLAVKEILTWKFLNEKVNMSILVNGQSKLQKISPLELLGQI
jgi:hypothetical protein